VSFPRYPKYKPSGVEWLGEVPETWEVRQLGHISVSRCDGPFGSGLKSEHYAESGIRVIRLQNIKTGWFADEDHAFISSQHASELVGHDVSPGDILIAGLGDENNSVGRACVAPAGIGQAMVKADCFRFRLDTVRADSSFIAAALSAGAEHDGGVLGTGSTRIRIPLSAMACRRLPLPPLAEQRAIAAFLDRETAKIDALIAEQEKLIELLAEKRQAVISHAVTKGLNPAAPMKPSGIEWLGDVPAHWGVVPLKHGVDIRSGGTPSKERTDYWDGNVPWASSKDMKLDDLFDTEDHVSRAAIEDGVAETVPAGTVLVVARGMILAHSFPVATVRSPMAINQDLKALKSRDTLASEFLAWLLRGARRECLRRTDEAAHGTKVLRMSDWTSMPICVPPPIEQHAIAALLDRETAKFDALVAEAEMGIELLRERRSALISAAVTGQIDVRNAVPESAA